ncbi:MAG: ABC transporter substrate-binding protein [Alphaproteobacteria bacterium]|nr:ABC transporter substrate-binding protein [Alphaproteobacteria bacterium]
MQRKLTIGLTAAVMAVGAGGFAVAQDTVVLGFAVAQSGWMAAYDGPPLNGALMAIDELNAAGGILGKQITSVVADTKTDTAEGAKAAAEVIDQGAQFMAVSCDYDMGASAATVANDAKMIAISFCASDAKMGVQGIGPYVFSLEIFGQGEGAVAAAFAWKQGWRKAYALLDASIEYDKSVCDGFLEHWAKLGGEMIGADTFMQEDASIASQITRYKEAAAANSEPEILALCSYVPGATSAIRQIRAAGIDAAIIGGDSMDGDYWVAGVPGLSNHYAVTFGSKWGDDPDVTINDFFGRYEAKFGVPETSFPLNGYSFVQAIKIAAERAGSLETEAVLAELNKFTKEPLLWGATTFTPDLHIDVIHPMTVVQIQDGKGSFADRLTVEDPPALKLVFPEFRADLY